MILDVEAGLISRKSAMPGIQIVYMEAKDASCDINK